MPTPMPIIEIRIGVIVLKSVRLASRNSRPNAVPTEISANTIGMLAATSVRNTISSTSSATAKPMNSLAPCSGGACSASPVNSAVMPTLAEVGLHRVFEGDDLRALELEPVLGELHLGVADPRIGGREPLVVVGERAA